MKRLTERDEYGNADIIGVISADLQGNLDYDEMNAVTEALNRLAEYEDTGLEPDEIARLVDDNKSSTWVSVKDRPPAKDIYSREYNVVIKGAKRSTTLYYDGTWYDGGCRKYDVTHWQPLPEVAKGE